MIEFNTVLNAVDDLGLDPNGNDPIDSALASALDGGGTLVEFPEGTYFFDSEINFGSPDNWGIRGLGSSHTDVKFKTHDGEGRFMLATNGGRGQLVENVSFDYTSGGDGSLGIMMRGEDDLKVKDVEFMGFNPTEGNGAVLNLVPMATDPDGLFIVDGLIRTGPTDITSHGHLGDDSNESCIWLGSRHKGELVIKNSHIENSGTNAVYASRTPGTVHYDNCLFKNNNQTSIRIGGGAGQQNTIKNCVFVVDTDNAHPDNGGSFINPHGVTCETNDTEAGPILIENCEFEYITGPDRGRLLFIDGNSGPIEVVDSRFRSQVSAAEALHGIGDPRWHVPAQDQSIDIRESHFSGVGAVDVDNRPATIHSGCVSAPIEGVNIASGVSRESCTIPGSPSQDASKIVITGTGVTTNYHFTVGGTLNPTDDVERWDDVTETSVSGWITSEGVTDTYLFTGPLGRVTFSEGEAIVTVDGVEVNPSTLSTSETHPNTIQIPGTGVATNYRISVTGEIRDHPVLGTPLSDFDVLSNGVLEGWSTDEMDAIEFSGTVESIEILEGDGPVYENGVKVDLSEDTTETEQLPNTIVIDGTATDQPTSYTFTVSGEVERSDELSSEPTTTGVDKLPDTISGSTVEGFIQNNVDGYRYSGEIVDISVSGDVDVNMDHG